MFEKILVVCVGNICRSPTAERLLKQTLPQKDISSAGIAVQRSGLTGKSADKMAQEISLAHGVSVEGHQARQLTPALCQQHDLILVMEKGHIDAVAQIAPEARGKVMLLGHFCSGLEIPDPYRLSREAFEQAYELMEQSVDAWSKKLSL